RMEVGGLGDGWYFAREEIDEFSPSRKHGIDAKKEINLRKSYCSFIKDVGVALQLPQVAIASAIVFCHRFYLRHSHHDHDRYTIATACVFLSGKVEETPKTIMKVTVMAYEIRHKRDPAASERIKQKECYEKQKELVLMAERVVLATLGFDLNVQHPYKYLVTAIKIFKVAQTSLAQVAWNFVNDGLITTLCLQFKPQHIAAGAIFLAAKFLRVKLPSDRERPWWQEFDVTPRQLEDVSNQMLELYEQSKTMAASASNDISPSQGQASNSPIYTKPCNMKTETESDAMTGHRNQGSIFPNPAPNMIDIHETIKSRCLGMQSSAESAASPLGDEYDGKNGNRDVQEAKCINTLDGTNCVEKKMMKRTRWDNRTDKECIRSHGYVYGSSCRTSHLDAPAGELSTVTSIDEQVQLTSKGMVSSSKRKVSSHSQKEYN
ncbi:hypothetical protein KI387_038594, partial [Taxus chinensis]